MKKKFRHLFSVMSAMCLLTVPVPAAAVDVLAPACEGVSQATLCQDNNTAQPASGNAIYGPNGVLTKAARLIAVIVGIVSVIMIIISGFKYITSSGDPNNIKSAKDTLLFAIVGIVVALMAQSIIVFVLNKL